MQTHRLILFTLVILVVCETNAQAHNDEPDLALITPGFLQESFKDSLIIRSESRILNLLSSHDTINAIIALNELAQVYTNRTNYASAYDSYWNALLLAKQINHLITQSASYNGLGILYSIYERRETALDYYLQALDINKQLVNERKLDSVSLRNNYFPLAIHYRYEQDPITAGAYLDSCEAIETNSPFTDIIVGAERAYLEILRGNYQQALINMSNVREEIQDAGQFGYLTIYHSLLGDLYIEMNNPKEAASSYLIALAYASEYLNHLNFVPDIYNKLAEIMLQRGDYQQANVYLSTAYDLDQWLYSSKSPNNQFLLEIKDRYREEQENQARIINEQRVRQLEQEEQILLLNTAILVVTLVLILFGGIVWVRKLRRKNQLERLEFDQRQQLEEEKNREIMAIKNRELTNSALQIIAKDELLSSLKEGLSDIRSKTQSKEAKQLLNSIKINQDMSWLEFENRFTSVNGDFFEKLKQQFPHLKEYDLKICALIKLKFSGKEMARLLGISPESANTSRYRLRKRLGLSKEENLTEFINAL
ncbi:MAG: tetratricopeptide repeat protein [Cyclobacteriaceae bacterium]